MPSASWTIKKKGEEFFIAATAHIRYAPLARTVRQLHRATTAIARKLQMEFARRHNQMVQR